MRSSLSWDTWDVDERFARQIIEAAHRRAGKVETEEEKARRTRQMRNAERVKELALIISKKNNSVAERVRCYIRHSQEVEEDIRKLTQKMNEEMDPAKRAALQAEIRRLEEDFDMKLVQRRQLLHNDLGSSLYSAFKAVHTRGNFHVRGVESFGAANTYNFTKCTYFPLSEITRLEHSIEKLRKID